MSLQVFVGTYNAGTMRPHYDPVIYNEQHNNDLKTTGVRSLADLEREAVIYTMM